MTFLEYLVSASIVALFAWIFNNNARIGVLEAKEEGLKELILSELRSISDRVGRIERTLNGAWKRTE